MKLITLKNQCESFYISIENEILGLSCESWDIFYLLVAQTNKTSTCFFIFYQTNEIIKIFFFLHHWSISFLSKKQKFGLLYYFSVNLAFVITELSLSLVVSIQQVIKADKYIFIDTK